MLQIDPSRIHAIASATCAADLYSHLQAAIELEHATIPVYLTAFFSIKKGFMEDTRTIIKSIFVEEMLHMTIAANVLNAIGGKPVINRSCFIPSFPGPLPMGVGGSLIVSLAPLSLDHVKKVFMGIEEPEHPIDFPVKLAAIAAGTELATIGVFYHAIIRKIHELGDRIFTGDPSRQVAKTPWFPNDELFAIRNANDAILALELIVLQGEGTSKSPLDPEGNLAHFYRFEEIYNQKRLVPDPTETKGYSFSGAPVPFVAEGVWDMVSNPKAAQFKPGSRARQLMNQFNLTYTGLLNALHDTFNGAPHSLHSAMGLMYELNILGGQVVETKDEVTGKQAAPSFEFALENAAV
jgi:hypothetical protein